MAKAGERVAILMIKDPNDQVRYGQIDQKVPENAVGKVLVVHPDTPSVLIRGLRTGAFAERKYDLSQILNHGITDHKDKTYTRMLDIAQDVAEDTIQSSRFGKNGLVHNIAQEAGLAPADISCMLRCVRAEMAIETVLDEHRGSFQLYIEGIADAVASGMKFPPHKTPKILKMLKSWSGGGLVDLNRYLAICSNYSKSIFLPFEIAAFRRFYEERMNNECGLSNLDKIILNGRIHIDPNFGIQDSYKEVFDRTGLCMDDAVATRHLNVLLGKFRVN